MSGLDAHDRILIEKYGERSLMYTEYPGWRQWSDCIGDGNYRSALRAHFEKNPHAPLSLYVHVPHCHKQCLFCTCYVKITQNYEEVKRDCSFIFKELEMLANFFSSNDITPNIKEIHLGGGSPTYLHREEFDSLIDRLGMLARIDSLDEFAVEIDPRHVKPDGMRYYHEKGINRISFGIQDFDIGVQEAVDRVQPAALAEKLLVPELRGLFKNGVNFDIICGLPRQTVATMRATMEKVAEFSPDRVCLNYMHKFPEFYPHQNKMPQSEIPDNFQRKELFLEALDILTRRGYVRIGYDHFAKSADSLAIALKNGSLVWNRLGPTPGRVFDCIAAGYSGVSTFGDMCYFQNQYDFSEYQKAVRMGVFPVQRGYFLKRDDVIRRDVIHQIRNYFFLRFGAIEAKYFIVFKNYFRSALAALAECEADGIARIEKDSLVVTEIGHQFADYVCSRFDAYRA